MYELVAETQGFEHGLLDGLGLALRWDHGKQDILIPQQRCMATIYESDADMFDMTFPQGTLSHE
jgi:hypothetical protein